MSNSRQSTIKIFVGLFLFCFLFIFVDIHKVWEIVLRTRFSNFFLAIVLVFFGIFLSVIKWNVFLRENNFRYPFNLLLKYYLIGLFMNNFFPSSVGGDVVRIVLFRSSGRTAQVAASVFLERLSGFLMLAIIVGLALLGFPEYFEISGANILLWAIVAPFLFVFVLVANKADFVVKNIRKLVKTNTGMFLDILQKFLKVLDAIILYRSKKMCFSYSLLISFLFILNNVLVFYLVVRSIGVDVQFLKILIVGPVVLLVSAIPISFNSLGLAEGAFLILFAQIGLNQEEAMATALLVRAILLIVSLFGGILWVFSYGSFKNRLTKDENGY